MIKPNHTRLSIVKQCSLMSVSRSSFYHQAKGESPFNLKLMRLIDEQWLETPFLGSRRMARHLRALGYNVSRKRVRRLMRKMGIAAIYPKPRTTTLEADFCVAALEDAIAEYGTPDIFNTDQGSQFTSSAFTGLLREKGIKISMDGKGAWMDNVFIERLWWSVKYECVYINEFEDVRSLKKSLTDWISFYNAKRPHSSLDHLTPDEAYFTSIPKAA